jgi:hypothetical protein
MKSRLLKKRFSLQDIKPKEGFYLLTGNEIIQNGDYVLQFKNNKELWEDWVGPIELLGLRVGPIELLGSRLKNGKLDESFGYCKVACRLNSL